MKEYRSLRDYVRTYISDGINSGQFQLGDRISEQSVADMLDVSRTPAREALMQLHSEGVLDYTPRKGFAIKRVGEKEKKDIYETTALLDAYTAVSALPRMEEADLDAMRECIEKIDIAIKYRNTGDYRSLQHLFHDIYRKKCDNEVVLRFLKTLESGLVPHIYLADDEDLLYGLYGSINDEHREIVRLFEAGERDRLFIYLMDTHWEAQRPGLEPARNTE